MKLTDLLSVIEEDTIVWISEDPAVTEGIYFGFIGKTTPEEALTMGYEVVTAYPERYPAAFNHAGISIIVKKVL